VGTRASRDAPISGAQQPPLGTERIGRRIIAVGSGAARPVGFVEKGVKIMLKHRRRGRHWYVVLVLYSVVIAFQEPLAHSCSAAAGADPAERLVRKLMALADAKPLDPTAGDDELRKLQKARYNSAVRRLRHGLQSYSAGRLHLDELLEPLQNVRDSSLDLSNDPAQCIAILALYSDLARWAESSVQTMVQVGQRSDSDLEHARYVRLGAEIQLLRARSKLEECERK
jgi:hypothetical protein